MDAVARACQQAAQLQEAVELYMHADRPEPALHLINQMVWGDGGWGSGTCMERGDVCHREGGCMSRG